MASMLSPSAVYRIIFFVQPMSEKKDQLTLALKGEADDEDVRAIFAHGKPLHFWSCPRLLVSKIVEAFKELHEEPACVDVTITACAGHGANSPSKAWAEVYTTLFPCHACTTLETVEAPRNPHRAVEKFHVSSEHFRKQLIVELHCELTRVAVIARVRGATLLLQPDLASEVFGFLDRALVGSSLLANRDLHDLLHQLKQRLPVHRLECGFNEVLSDAAYWMSVSRIRRDLSYTDVRHFMIPSTAGAENDCALIRHYLSNSHVAYLRPPCEISFPFTIKMLASLASRNVSVGDMHLDARAERLSDYRSMDLIFGGMQMSELDLSCCENRFFELVKITDFFRMPTVQGLRGLRLTLMWSSLKEPRGHARSMSPLWVSGIHLLRHCAFYEVHYMDMADDHLRAIERKIVQICEAFERGEITGIVEHFRFQKFASKGMHFAFSRDNLLVSGTKVEGDRIDRFEWDVYRFKNASTNEYLTACVGQTKPPHYVESFLHIVKGEVYPDASFSDHLCV
ncbi:hypothetical protein AAVH_17438 [Aphelenchoides avenae]|nr:hypothetical protein AAVH_17438 [Aphelenchus avenae]